MSTIKIRKGMKFRLVPNTAQKADMAMFAGHNRAAAQLVPIQPKKTVY